MYMFDINRWTYTQVNTTITVSTTIYS